MQISIDTSSAIVLLVFVLLLLAGVLLVFVFTPCLLTGFPTSLEDLGAGLLLRVYLAHHQLPALQTSHLYDFSPAAAIAKSKKSFFFASQLSLLLLSSISGSPLHTSLISSKV